MPFTRTNSAAVYIHQGSHRLCLSLAGTVRYLEKLLPDVCSANHHEALSIGSASEEPPPAAIMRCEIIT